MPNHFTCANGHRWKTDGDVQTPPVCPTCGDAASVTDTPPVVEPTVSMSPDGVPAHGRDETVWKVLGPEPVAFDSDPDLNLPASPPKTEDFGNSKLEGLAASAAAYRPTIPGYETLDELGRGGMGVVYKARHVRLKRLVALKMVLAGAHAAAEDLERFVTEAEAAARLQHLNIVQIYEIGEHEGRPYFSLEYVEGGSLADRLDGKPLPPRPVARLVEALARAMHYAHERGIVHRDLKPANVLLAPGRDTQGAGRPARTKTAWLEDAVPKITDFGLAKKLDADGGQTRTGSILGTPNYMSPEQATGQIHAIGPASDIYGLGAILYELLTGRPPFQGESPFDTLRRVASAEPVPPRSLVGGLPRDVETICLKCLHKDPRRRYADAVELARDLRRFQDGETIRARPTPTWERAVKWTRRRPAAASLLAAGMVGLVITVTAGVLWNARLRADAAREAARSEELAKTLTESQRRQLRLTIANGAHLLDEGDLIGSLPWFAEAMHLEQDNPQREAIHRLRLAAVLEQCPELVSLWFHGAKVNAIAFSPNGRQVLTASDDGTAQLCDVLTGSTGSRTLRHGKPVLEVAFSPDGEFVATASADGTAQIWHSDSGAPFGEPLKHPDAVVSVGFSPDGQRLLTACKDGKARLWVVPSQELLPPAPAHSAPLTQASFSPDGKLILTAAADGSVQLWNAENGVPLARPARQRGRVLHAAFSPDGRFFLTASADGVARVWHTHSGLPATPPLQHRGGVLRASFSPDGRLIATAGADQTARVWNARTGQAIGTPFRHGSKVYAAVFGPAARRLLTASDDDTARVWDAMTGAPLSPPLKHNGSVRCVAFSPDGRWVATAGVDGMVRLWSATAAHQHVPLLRHNGQVRQAVVSPDGRFIATASDDRTAHIWDGETGEPVGSPMRHSDAVTSLAFTLDGRLLVTAGRDGWARLWNAHTGEPLNDRQCLHGQPLNDIAVRPDGARFVTAGDDGTARIWDVATGSSPVPLLKHGGPVLTASFSGDGRQVLTASADGMARLWNAETGTMIVECRHGNAVNSAAFDRDGGRVVTASADHTARVWNAATGEPIGMPMRHGSPVVQASFSPDGHHVLTASDDNTARIWDATSGEAITPPLHHMGSLRRAVFSPGGDLVATASEDGTARVWDAQTGEPITPPLKHHGATVDVAFSPDGSRLVTSGPNAARLWRLAQDRRPLEDLVRSAQVLAVGRIDDTGGLVALDTEALRAAWRGLKTSRQSPSEMSQTEASAWHRREVEECEMCDDWYGAAWHADRLLAAHPRDSRLLRLRADARAGLGDWQRALDDYGRAIEQAPRDWEVRLRRGLAHAQLRQWQLAAADFAANHDLGPDEPRFWHYYALAKLAAGDVAAYRTACADLLQRFGRALDVETARQVVWTAVLGPQAVPTPARLVTEAERALQARPKNPVYQLTLATALLRAGRPIEAADKLEPIAQSSAEHSLHAQLFLVLAYQQAGKEDDARQWLDRAVETLDETAGERENPRTWDRRLELEILRNEAERFFKQGKP